MDQSKALALLIVGVFLIAIGWGAWERPYSRKALCILGIGIFCAGIGACRLLPELLAGQ